MKILFINSVIKKGSTGKIVYSLAQKCAKDGNDVVVAFGRGNIQKSNIRYFKVSSKVGILIHVLLSRLFDVSGFCSKIATNKFIKFIDKEKPDIVNIHNIHGYYINVPILLNYLAKHHIKTVFTLHDCWLFTGHCAYFDSIGCSKWKSCCNKCFKKRDYPKSILFDRSCQNFMIKKKSILKFQKTDVCFVTPSVWLKNICNETYIKDFDVYTIHNGIDVSLFSKKIKINKKFEILGAASPWSKRKGFDDFLKLSCLLDKDVYEIILIGLTKKQISLCKKFGINGVGIVSNDEMIRHYQKSDLFVNFTYEDNYPTVNLEALACGTPVLSYDTGGSGECIIDKDFVVKKGDVSLAAETIKKYKETIKSLKVRLKTPYEISFDKMYGEYIDLFKRISIL